MILGIDYQSAKRRVEFYDSLGACAARAYEARLTKQAKAISAILADEADAYFEASRVVEEYEREETERIARRIRSHAETQMKLAPRPRAVGAL